MASHDDQVVVRKDEDINRETCTEESPEQAATASTSVSRSATIVGDDQMAAVSPPATEDIVASHEQSVNKREREATADTPLESATKRARTEGSTDESSQQEPPAIPSIEPSPVIRVHIPGWNQSAAPLSLAEFNHMRSFSVQGQAVAQPVSTPEIAADVLLNVLLCTFDKEQGSRVTPQRPSLSRAQLFLSLQGVLPRDLLASLNSGPAFQGMTIVVTLPQRIASTIAHLEHLLDQFMIAKATGRMIAITAALRAHQPVTRSQVLAGVSGQQQLVPYSGFGPERTLLNAFNDIPTATTPDFRGLQAQAFVKVTTPEAFSQLLVEGMSVNTTAMRVIHDIRMIYIDEAALLSSPQVARALNATIARHRVTPIVVKVSNWI